LHSLCNDNYVSATVEKDFNVILF